MKKNKDSDNIEKCYQKSIELLKNNSNKYGFLASSFQKRAAKRNYLSIFARDSSICSLGAIASGDKDLIKTSKNSILTLGKNQAENGQIPNFVKPEKKEVDFWYMGCIDSTLWWLIVIKFYDKYSGDKKLIKILDNNIKKAVSWLDCQAHPKDGLLIQNEASDWADIMPRSGKVLYSNTLWCEVKRLYRFPDYKKTVFNFNMLFNPFCKDKTVNLPKRNSSLISYIKKHQKKTDYYLSFVNYRFWGEDIDVYANSLAVIFGIPDNNFSKKIITKLASSKNLENLPMPVLFNPIKENSELWRGYMGIHKQNYPNQYHNGGIWPFTSCFWAMALARYSKEEALIELGKIAEANKSKKWQFNEWFHGETGKAMGMKGQSWNAGAFLLAYHYINKDIKI
jgi:glycogen debranching enzyme